MIVHKTHWLVSGSPSSGYLTLCNRSVDYVHSKTGDLEPTCSQCLSMGAKGFYVIGSRSPSGGAE